jgi:Na+/H+ antiporter NhaD/arsenite permease-like protein
MSTFEFILFDYRIGLGLDSASLTDVKSLLLFFAFTIIGSNVFSNVPLTLLVLEQVPLTGDHLGLILYLAFLTTIAGNLTLFGSVANLIVAQKALTSPLKHRFDFWTYFKFGFPTTVLFSLVGMFIIYGLLIVIK